MIDVFTPIIHIPLHQLRLENGNRIFFDFVAQPMGHGVRVGPLHRKAFLHKETSLILVSLPDPLPHHGV